MFQIFPTPSRRSPAIPEVCPDAGNSQPVRHARLITPSRIAENVDPALDIRLLPEYEA